MKIIATAVAAAALMALSTPAAEMAAAESLTLKRTGTTSAGTDRPRGANETARDIADEDTGNGEDVADTGDEDGGSWGGGDEQAGEDDRSSTRTLVVRSDRRARHRHTRRHCVESYWISCGERQRTLWIFN